MSTTDVSKKKHRRSSLESKQVAKKSKLAEIQECICTIQSEAQEAERAKSAAAMEAERAKSAAALEAERAKSAAALEAERAKSDAIGRDLKEARRAVGWSIDIIEEIAYVKDDLVVAEIDLGARRADLQGRRLGDAAEVVAAEAALVAQLVRDGARVLDRARRAESSARIAAIARARARLDAWHALDVEDATAAELMGAREAVVTARIDAVMQLAPPLPTCAPTELTEALSKCDRAERGIVDAEGAFAHAYGRRDLIAAALSRSAVARSGGYQEVEEVDPSYAASRLQDASACIRRTREQYRTSSVRSIGRLVDAVLFTSDWANVAPMMLSALSDARGRDARGRDASGRDAGRDAGGGEWSAEELLAISERDALGPGSLAQVLHDRWGKLVEHRSNALLAAQRHQQQQCWGGNSSINLNHRHR